MKSAVSLICAAFFLFGILAVATAQDAARPSQAGQGEVVASVCLLDGSAKVKAKNGHVFKAAPGMSLHRTDEVEAGSTGFVVLRLKNGYLVRIDEEISLKMTDIYLLDAPRTSDGVRAQVDRLLTKKELARGERIAGWHAQVTAADTVAPVAATSRSTSGASIKKSDVDRREPPRSPEPKLQSKGSQGAGAGVSAPRKSARHDGELAAEQPEKEKAARQPPTWYMLKKSKHVKAKSEPGWIRKIMSDAGLGKCLKKELSRLPVSVDRVRLMLRIRDYRVQKLQLGGALPVPKCAEKGILYKPVKKFCKNCWIVVEVDLP
jgi:hypothetical protein